MAFDLPFRWNEPGTWPWIVSVWLALALAGWIKPLWRFLQQQRTQRWPTTHGRIEEVRIIPKKQFLAWPGFPPSEYAAELAYSYAPVGETFSGCWKQEFGSEAEAREFVRDLQGRSVVVSYDLDKPSSSTLLKSAIAELLEGRPPAPAADGVLSRGTEIPSWIKPLLWPFVLLSAIGLSLSLWVHFGAVAGRKVAPEPYFWMLHVGIFVVWFPTVLVANRRVGNARRKDYWDAVFKGSPIWFKYVVYAFLAYAFLNFLIFLPQAPGKKDYPGDGTPVVVWRGFSGHWMVFYAAALAILYSAARTPSESRIEPPPPPPPLMRS